MSPRSRPRTIDVAEQREGRPVDVAAHDDRQASPEAGVRRAHDLGPVLERLRRRDHLEAQQLLADAEDVARLERLLAVDLEEDAVEAPQVTDDDPFGPYRQLGVTRRQVGVGVEQRRLPAADDVLPVVERMRAALRAVGPDEDEAAARDGDRLSIGRGAGHEHRTGTGGGPRARRLTAHPCSAGAAEGEADLDHPAAVRAGDLVGGGGGRSRGCRAAGHPHRGGGGACRNAHPAAVAGRAGRDAWRRGASQRVRRELKRDRRRHLG